MKLAARITNEKGKVITLAGNEYLDIDITVGSRTIARLTVRENELGGYSVYDEADHDIHAPRLTDED